MSPIPIRAILAFALAAAMAMVVAHVAGCSERGDAAPFQHDGEAVVGADVTRALQLRVASDGTVVSRPRDGARVAFRGATVGRSGSADALLGAQGPTLRGARAELARGGLVEWYEQRPDGVEQGFRVEQRPTGAGPLVVRVALDGAEATSSQRPNEIDLRASGAPDPSFRYGALAAEDARGRSLAASMTAEGPHVIAITVSDDGAVYPVTIDPLVWGLRTRLTALSSEPLDLLGVRVAIDADTILAGVPSREAELGGLAVFRRGSEGWKQEALVPPPYVGAWLFGAPVTIDGECAFTTSTRAAYVYARIGTTWALVQSLPTNEPTQEGPPYAASPLAYANGVVALVTPFRSLPDGGVPERTTLFYEERGGAWEITSTLPLSPIPGNAGSIAMNGERFVVGTGSRVLVYRRGADRAFTLESTLAGDETTAFGNEVALLDGVTLMVGSPNESAVYAYGFVAGTWARQQKIVGPSASSFGTALALTLDTVWIGAPTRNGSAGAVFRYRHGSSWTLDEEIASPGTALGNFGAAVAADRTTAVFSAPVEGNGRGAIYVYELAQARGDACASGPACASGFCVDGVCCDSSCGGGRPGSCQTCVGDKRGICTVSSRGTSCRPAATACDIEETCDGTATTCPLDAIAPNGAACAGGTCGGGACRPPTAVAESPVVETSFRAAGGGCSSGPRRSALDETLLAPILAVAWLALRRRRRQLVPVLLACGLAVLEPSDSRAPAPAALAIASPGVRAQFFDAHEEIEDLDTGRTWALAFVGFGRDGHMSVPALGAPQRAATRIERASLPVVEWFEGAEQGLEHGFDILERPAGGSSLVLRLSVTDASGLRASGQTLRLDAARSAIAYGKLEARDVDGRLVPSTLGWNEGAIEIRVDDRDAHYPLVVDPLVWRERQTLHPSVAAAGARFGSTISSSGDRAIVGAPSEDGADSAHVYLRVGNDWVLEARLTNPDGAGVTRFGAATTISGSRLAIGAPSGGTSSTGAVYVFERSGSAWSYASRITSPDGAPSLGFGAGLALDGDDLAIGAPRQGIGAEGDPEGAVFLFHKTASGWSSTAKLQGLLPHPAHFFGQTIALQGDSLAVAGCRPDAYTPQNALDDSVWFFARSGASWSLLREDTYLGVGLFGASLALDGDVAAVGRPYGQDTFGILTRAGGSVQLYARGSGSWTPAQRLTAPAQTRRDGFGAALSLRGDRLLVGALYDADGAGAAYLFAQSGGAWSVVDGFRAGGVRIDDLFGAAVSLAPPDSLLIGAPVAGTVTAMILGPEGNSCSSGAACASGLCIDGVCCASACGGGDPQDCLACSVAAGAEQDGTCAVVRPRECRPARGACDVADACDGIRAECPPDRVADNGVPCADGVCSAGVCLASLLAPSADGGAAPPAADARGCTTSPRPAGSSFLLAPSLAVAWMVLRRRGRR